ncbi:hypothetical protein L1267_15975 [Pseudoalteromonas sp. OFAV1]|uniref:hypothetical protein n=1 Tax=Pseudoalteromonas sp. OFAV1 TaxID=2908892 RepID=UPI001F29683F|nr:hypothetical protein [Pseudoalteromonas sp. OFAV1]MCF2901875.1 hypothetical protein [Pseudoalteromonas sp. OFAV1]
MTSKVHAEDLYLLYLFIFLGVVLSFNAEIKSAVLFLLYELLHILSYLEISGRSTMDAIQHIERKGIDTYLAIFSLVVCFFLLLKSKRIVF